MGRWSAVGDPWDSTPTEPECGTNSGYTHGCRCVDCKYAHGQANRENRQTTKAAQIRKRVARPVDAWLDQGRCRTIPLAHRQWFFSEDPGEAAQAKEICRTCPVRVQCLEYAIVARERYVWGGESERGRKRIRREREMGLTR